MFQNQQKKTQSAFYVLNSNNVPTILFTKLYFNFFFFFLTTSKQKSFSNQKLHRDSVVAFWIGKLLMSRGSLFLFCKNNIFTLFLK